MQVFCNPQVERCFTVPAARRIYATSDQVAVAEINHFHYRSRAMPFTATNQRKESRCCPDRHVPIQRTDPPSKELS
jgi:hypothetical protein